MESYFIPKDNRLLYETVLNVCRFLVDDAALYLSDKCNTNIVDLEKSKLVNQ